MRIPAGQFKAHCLRLIDDVARTHATLVVTKRGHPVVKVIPAEDAAPPPVFGCMKGTIVITGDLIPPIEENWDAERDA